MRVESHLTEGARLELTHALLLYTAPGRQMATVHKVGGGEGGPPFLLPGECLTREAIEELMQSLHNTKAARHILPPEVLCASGVLCWWKAASRLPIFFNTKDATFNQALGGKEVLHPPLVFLAKPGRLQIFALQQNERPTAETTLCRAPYYNLYGGDNYQEGTMCQGNVRLPEVIQSRDIPLWERAFFATNFTHSNYQSNPLTRHKGGHNRLWEEARHWDYYSAESPRTAHSPHLVPLKLTLLEAVNT